MPSEEQKQVEPGDSRPAEQDEGFGLDVRVLLIVLLIVAFVVAAYFNKRWYSRKKALERQEQSQTARPPGEQEKPQRPPTPAEWYEQSIAAQTMLSAQTIFRAGKQLFLLGRPPLQHQAEDGRVGFMAGDLFEITRRAENLKPQFLLRMMGPGGELFYKDALPAIGLTEKPIPVFKKASDVTELKDDDQVIGVAYSGHARAYPIRLMNTHVIVNDTLGETPIVVIWSAVIDAHAVFLRHVNGKTFRFGFAGLIYQSAVVTYDRETESLWSGLNGAALTGESLGLVLQSIPALRTSWAYWKEQHPDTELFIGTDPKLPLDYTKDPSLPAPDYLQSPYVQYPVEGFDFQKSLIPPKTRVLGVAVKGAVRAYPYDKIQAGPIEDTLGDTRLLITYNPKAGCAEVTVKETEPAPQLYSNSMLWIGWKGLHPQSDVYGVASPE